MEKQDNSTDTLNRLTIHLQVKIVTLNLQHALEQIIKEKNKKINDYT